jgi:endo-1,4-beta-xylanase
VRHGVQLRGHTLVWHAQTPDWFFKEGYKNDGALVDRETMLYRLESYIKQYMTYVQDKYPGVVYCWDVVNEAVEPSAAGDPNSFFYCRKSHGDGLPNLWYQVLGQDYVEMAFTYARKYAADGVALFYNDYGTFDPKKLENIYKLCDYLNSKDLIDGIGMQGYWGISSPTLGTLKTAINKYAELGLQLQITELSIGAEGDTKEAYEAQGTRYASIMRLLQSLDTAGGGKADIIAVTFFGLMDGYMLYSNDTNTSRLFDSGLQPKPAFKHILETFEMFY